MAIDAIGREALANLDAALRRIAALKAENERLKAVAITLAEALERAQNMPLLMKTWEKASRDAAYDEIQKALAEWENLMKEEANV